MLKQSMVAVLAVALMVGCGDDEEADETPGGDAGAAGAVEPGEGGAGGARSSEGGAGGGPEGDEELVARGQYLVDHVIACPDCHTPRDPMGAPVAGEYMAGWECFVTLEDGSCLHSRNLTNDETGLANRTDDEIKQMITDGVRPSATGEEALSPVMPYYVFANLDEADLDAIVAYLRTIPPVEHSIPASDEIFEVPAPVNAIDPETIPMPDEDYEEYDLAVAGRYLATQSGLCIECHSPHEMGSADVILPENFFIGGEAFPLGIPDFPIPVSKNLTSDPETGLGDWTVDEIVTAFTLGTDKNGDGLCPPMPSGAMAAYGGLTEEDALAIAHYIKSLPAKENEVEDMCTWPPM
jgi:hypothetical protein